VLLSRACIVSGFVLLLAGAWSGLASLLGPESAAMVVALWLIVGTRPANHHPFPRELNPVRRLVAGAVAWLLLLQAVGHAVL
jgi:hypothetical protein